MSGDRPEKATTRLDQLDKALERLREATLQDPGLELTVDGTIQRFEFVFELTWKAARAVLEHYGRELTTPRTVLRAAYAEGWLDTEDTWLRMLDDRNRTSHTYDAPTAEEIYRRICADYLPVLLDAAGRVRDRWREVQTARS